MITLEGKEYLSREDVFAMRQEGFQVNPLDINLAKAQYELLKMVRSELVNGKNSVETEFEMHSPQMTLSKVRLMCFLITGTKEMYDVVIRVEDLEHEHCAYGWITMGSCQEIEEELNGNKFVPECKKWVKWLDYARKNYPMKNGRLYYWTEWESIEAENHWYKSDPDLYGISDGQVRELLPKLITCYNHELPDGRLFEKDTVIRCAYSGAPGSETKFDGMALELVYYVTGRIDLVGIIWFDINFKSIPTQIIIHSFDSVAKCIWWLGREHNTAHDCHLRMGNLLKCGWSYIRS